MQNHMSGSLRWGLAATVFAAGISNQAAAGAGTPPNYGHDFVTVGAPGNRAALDSERHYGSAVSGFPNLGVVGHEFRISRTETTAGQWIDFLNAAWPHTDARGISRNDSRLTGPYIDATSTAPGTNPGWHTILGGANKATTMSFRLAAWYCNWLHNGRPTDSGAITLEMFTTGAYDDATLTRQAGAQFWIPSLDEWTKAVYYDPNRHGAGQDGYWLHPGMSQVPLAGGPPGLSGAQTSAGFWLPPNQLPPDVGLYPSVQSPWGLLDTSGGATEWTDTEGPFFPNEKLVRGSALGSQSLDRNDYMFITGGFDGSVYGFRIASAIPSPNMCIPMVIGCVFWGAERRRRMD